MKDVLIYCDGSSLGNGQGEERAAAVALLGYRGTWRAFGRFLGPANNPPAGWMACGRLTYYGLTP